MPRLGTYFFCLTSVKRIQNSKWDYENPLQEKSRPKIMGYFYERSIIATLRCLKQSYLFYLCWTCERSETWGGRCFVFPSFIRLRGLFFQVSISKAKRTKYKFYVQIHFWIWNRLTFRAHNWLLTVTRDLPFITTLW